MRSLEEYLALPYRLELIPDPYEGGYAASYPDLPGCITGGDTPEEAVRNAAEAKAAWMEAAMEEGVTIPEPKSEEDYSGQFKLRIPKSLHRELAINAKKEGVSMNHYCSTLLTMGVAQGIAASH